MNDNNALEHQLKSQYIDLASERIGGETLSCSDDFFAPMENLLKAGRGIFIEDKYTDRGKWMDGWESRRSYGRHFGGRNRGREFDWCIIRLGVPGVIYGFDIDTNFFRGNAPESVTVEACNIKGEPDENTHWTIVLDKSDVAAHSQNLFEIINDNVWTHVRLNIFPDGGVARFRVYGRVANDFSQYVIGESIDLAAAVNGGRAVLASDMFFSDKNNLIMPGRGKNMGDGWETKRRRDPGPDWLIVELAALGHIQKVIVDTHHFKGNFPDSFSLQAGNFEASQIDETTATDDKNWYSVIEQTPLAAHREHCFVEQIISDKTTAFTHVRLRIFPDGGVSRMRIIGQLAASSQSKAEIAV